MMEDLKAMNKLHSVTSEVPNNSKAAQIFCVVSHLIHSFSCMNILLIFSQKNGSKVNKSSNNTSQNTSHSKFILSYFVEC